MKKQSITDIATRYPNLVRAIQWIASANSTDARLAIWAYKTGERINAPSIVRGGGPRHLISQVARYRNI